jgi:hypothetical protein
MSTRRAAHLMIALSFAPSGADRLQVVLRRARRDGRAVQPRQHRVREKGEPSFARLLPVRLAWASLS